MDYYNLSLSEHEINILLAALDLADQHSDDLEYDAIEIEDLISLLNHKLVESDDDML